MPLARSQLSNPQPKRQTCPQLKSTCPRFQFASNRSVPCTPPRTRYDGKNLSRTTAVVAAAKRSANPRFPRSVPCPSASPAPPDPPPLPPRRSSSPAGRSQSGRSNDATPGNDPFLEDPERSARRRGISPHRRRPRLGVGPCHGRSQPRRDEGFPDAAQAEADDPVRTTSDAED